MIYIIRHGQTDMNNRKVLQGRSDHPLNNAGIAQAQKAAYEKLKKDYEGFDENVQKMQDYQAAINANKEELPWTEEEYKAFTEGDYKKVMEQLDEAIKPELEKEVELDYKRFDAEGFSEWMESNNIDTKTGAYLSQFLLDDKTV